MMNLFNILLVFSDWSLFLLRLLMGIIFLVHGGLKLRQLKVAQENFQTMGLKPGWLWGTTAAIIEVAGGTLFVLGLWVQIPALILAAQMAIITLFKIKKGYRFIGGYEFDLLLIAAALILATLGGGALSLLILF